MTLSSPLSTSISLITITLVEGSPQKLTLFFRAMQETFSNYFLHRKDVYSHLDQIMLLIPDGLGLPARSVPHTQYQRVNSHQSVTDLWT